jgi:Putative metal-binding motif/FG-GAP-like repeat/FG-GAP repeat
VGPRLWAASCGPTFERDLPRATERRTQQDDGIQQGWTLWERPEVEGPLWIDVTVEGATVAQNGPDVALWTPEGGLWSYAGLKAWDANDRLLPAQMVAEDGYIRIQVEEAEAVWPITVDPVLSTASTTLTQNATDFGIGVGSGGDVNRDGYDDVIVGARFGTGLYGEAFSYHGSSTGVSTSYSRMWRGADYYGKYGEYVDNGGDVNGDNYDDAIVCEFYSERFFVYHGSSTGLVSSASTTVTGVYGLGRDLHIIGDWNKDGYRDLVAGTIGSTAYVYHGCPDTDGDGYCTDRDCNDNAAAINPAATESCDSVDNDCDGLIDDADTNVSGRSTYYRDADGDTYGSATTTTAACTRPTGYVSTSTDCNDGAAAISPAATEICDSVDNDCDSLIDDADSSVSGRSTYYRDNDSDGYGSAGSTTAACYLPTGYVSSATDCDDTSAVISPAGTESCDSIDNDCDGLVDDADSSVTGQSVWYEDADGDSFGGPNALAACVQPGGYAASSADCDDSSAAIHPAAIETCDSIDNDCDNLVDDADSNVGGQSTWYADSDGDSYGDGNSPTSACVQPASYVSSTTDCNDRSAAIHPAIPEICDSVDNNCDGLIDDADSSVTGQSTWYADGNGDGYGGSSSVAACLQPSGYVDASTDCDDSNASVSPDGSEICDGLDSDCDGLLDLDDPSNSGLATWYADSDGDGFGSADATREACSASEGYVGNADDCDDANKLVNPDEVEICDGADNNCDELADDEDPSLDGGSAQTWYGDEDGDGHGSESKTSLACVAPEGTVEEGQDCDDSDPTVYSGAPELEDGKDNDCDGRVDGEKADGSCGGCSASADEAQALWLALLPALVLRRRRKA